jgi:hypothetical protein
VKVFNTTDAATAALVSQGLANQSIKVGDTVIHPGKSAELRGTARERSELQVYLRVGAVALDELPVLYANKRGLKLDGTPIEPPKSEPEPPHPPPAEPYVDPVPADVPDVDPPKKGKK